MAAFSLDLRRSILEAWAQEEHSLPELSRLFGVSRSWLVKLLARWRGTGSLGPTPHGGGQDPRLDPDEEDLVEQWLLRTPDLALSELQERLEKRTGTRASLATLCRICQRLGLPRKKRRCRRPSATGPRCRSSGKPGEGIRPSWTPSTR